MDIVELRGPHPYRFLAAFQTWDGWRQAGMPEARRTGAAVCPATFASQYQFRTGTTLFKGMSYPEVRRLQLDIETTTLDPEDPDAAIIMVALKQAEFEQVLIRHATEEALLDELNRIIQRLDPDVIEGHNLYAFDIPYILSRARKLGIQLRWGRNKGAPSLREEGRQMVAYVHGRHVIDTLIQVQRFDIAGNLTRYGLKDVVEQLGLTRDDRVFVAGSDIRAMWEAGDHDRLARYALDDVRDVDDLSRLIMPNEFYQTQMVPLGYQQCALAGTGRKIDDVMIRAYLAAQHSIPAPMQTEPFPGGYVQLLQTGVINRVVKADVESLYPSIMIRNSIRSRNDVLHAFPAMLRDLRNRRIGAKRRSQDPNEPDRAMWDGLQGGFKILINSFFGYLGFGRGHFNDFDAAKQITLEGQSLIQQVVKSLRDAGASPIEVDTDGVYFQPPDSVSGLDDEIAFVRKIGANLPEGIGLAHDGSFRSMLSLKQKTYALLDHQNKLTLTGSSLRSRALEPCFREFISQAAKGFLEEDIDRVKAAYFSLAEAIRDQQLPIEDISQTIRPRQRTVGSRPKLAALLEQYPHRWSYGERISIYERSDGELAFAEDYAQDANVDALLGRLKDVIDRFRTAINDDAMFDALFPRISTRTNLDAAKSVEPTRQLGLFD